MFRFTGTCAATFLHLFLAGSLYAAGAASNPIAVNLDDEIFQISQLSQFIENVAQDNNNSSDWYLCSINCTWNKQAEEPYNDGLTGKTIYPSGSDTPFAPVVGQCKIIAPFPGSDPMISLNYHWNYKPKHLSPTPRDIMLSSLSKNIECALIKLKRKAQRSKVVSSDFLYIEVMPSGWRADIIPGLQYYRNHSLLFTDASQFSQLMRNPNHIIDLEAINGLHQAKLLDLHTWEICMRITNDYHIAAVATLLLLYDLPISQYPQFEILVQQSQSTTASPGVLLALVSLYHHTKFMIHEDIIRSKIFSSLMKHTVATTKLTGANSLLAESLSKEALNILSNSDP